jgi:hypothetical protein
MLYPHPEIMRDPACQGPDSLQPFSSLKLFLESFLLGNIPQDTLDCGLPLKGHQRSRDFRPEDRPVLADCGIDPPIKFHEFTIEPVLYEFGNFIMGFGFDHIPNRQV